MKVGDTVKLKPVMWKGVNPESYGMSFTGEYAVSRYIAGGPRDSIQLEGFKGIFDRDAFKLVFKNKEKEMSVHKYKVGDVLCCVSEDGCWYKVGEKYKVRKLAFDNDYGPAYNVEAHGHDNTYSLENDGVWVLEKDFKLVDKKQLKKFKIGDKVVCVKNTPSIQEGWVGYVDKVVYNYVDKGGYIITARQEYSTITYEFLSDELEVISREETLKSSKESQYTGGSSDYYKVFVKHPTTLAEPYEAECNDIIEALDMTFAEGNAFKAIWRKAKARQGVQKKGYDNGLYDSEKVVFFGERMVVEAKEKASESNEETKLD